MNPKILELREQAESDLEFFIRLVHPMRVLGSIHKEVIRWWQRPDATSHDLLLLPRDHMKSALIAYRCAWWITKYPAIRILYISATANLAEKQLGFIKQILDCPQYRKYWPEMLHREEGRRTRWSISEISVDHPIRIAEAVRDPTIFTAGLTTTITGMHCDVAVLDDVVIQENAYTEDGRQKVMDQYALLSSIEGTDSREWVVGTRYHPKDLYNSMQEMLLDTYNTDGEVTGTLPVYDTFERKVENIGDGSGEFLWPRQQRYDGKWFGFDQKILAKKKAQYLGNNLQFRAQYYNEPNDSEHPALDSSLFQYYDQRHLDMHGGNYYLKGNKLNVFASIDFAFSLSKRADFTAIVVVGVDSYNNYYVLEIDRFKTDRVDEYFKHVLHLQTKWGFRKLRAETTVAQKVIVEALKEHIKQYNLYLTIEDFRPTKYEGAKEERIQAALEPRYSNKQIWHYQGGNCQILEEELVLQNPAHDDVKDALASCISYCVPPQRTSGGQSTQNFWKQHSNSRFGGIS